MDLILPPPGMLADLRLRYGEPPRHYHTWAHIEALLRHFENHRRLVSDATAVLWAIYWHDAIYDPQAHDNEERSAAIFREAAANALDVATIDSVEAMIIATASHEIPGRADAVWRKDCGTFLDLDLSILAAPAAVFDAYEANVRKEYAFVPDAAFRIGRRAILERFLRRPVLYFTDELRDLWEDKARKNLRRSIVALAS